MHPIQNNPRPTLLQIGALGRNETNDTPHPQGDFTLEDIQQMAKTIVDNNHSERGLALEMLVNLAVRTDGIGKDAQKVLRDVYASPAVYAEPNTLAPHGKAEIRKSIVDRAHDMSEMVREGRATGADYRLSVTVDYLAGQSENADADCKRDIGKYLDDTIKAPEEQGEKWLDRTRMTNMDELLPASKAYGEHFPLARDASVSLALDQPHSAQAQADFSKAIRTMADDLPKSTCKAVWLHSGANGYPHFMPMVIQRASDDSLHFHILNTDKWTEHRDLQIKARLGEFFNAAKADAKAGGHNESWDVYPVSHAMQTHAGHSCGLLGHNLFKDLSASLKESTGKAGNADAMRNLINTHCKKWNGLPQEDVHAVVFSTHAELLQARADTGIDLRGMPDKRSPLPAVSQPVAGGLDPFDDETLEPGWTSLQPLERSAWVPQDRRFSVSLSESSVSELSEAETNFPDSGYSNVEGAIGGAGEPDQFEPMDEPEDEPVSLASRDALRSPEVPPVVLLSRGEETLS